jgi:hypothetical protein
MPRTKKRKTDLRLARMLLRQLNDSSCRQAALRIRAQGQNKPGRYCRHSRRRTRALRTYLSLDWERREDATLHRLFADDANGPDG